MRHIGYPFTRSIDADGGGAADLQTDVMRFMAIISLCLVAIFALVQSIPARVQTTIPTPPAPVDPSIPDAPAPEPVAVVTAPATEAGPEPPLTASLPPSQPPAANASMATAIPAPPIKPLAASPADSPVPSETPSAPVPEPKSEGFTLRFASDQALTALVAREDIGLYAISGGTASRMQLDRGRVTFWQASVPKQFHEMHPATVPASVRDALRRSGPSSDVTWAVTLPKRLSRDLDRYLSNYTGGELIIAANGTLRREE